MGLVVEAYVRSYLKVVSEPDHKSETQYVEPEIDYEKVIVIDTETTTDLTQNLKFGSCIISEGDRIISKILFFDPDNLTSKEVGILRSSIPADFIFVDKKSFVTDYLVPYAYDLGYVVVGLNLPFDLSRFAIKATTARKMEGFSLVLSENKAIPRIRIRHLSSNYSKISFSGGLGKDGRTRSFAGCFIDLRQLAFALTNKGHSLASLAEEFNVKMHSKELEHGKITKEYVMYNLNDTKVTWELYFKLKTHYENFGLVEKLHKLVSPASLGKAYLKQLGIQPFLKQNPNFPPKIIGYLMSAYYGGRSEVRIRKTPMKVTLIDFTSMYPTISILKNIQSILIAPRVEWSDATEKTKNFLNNLTIDTLRNPTNWGKLILVKIKPDGEVLPIRANFRKESINISLCNVSSEKHMWYCLDDVIAAKLLSGKIPEIIEAIEFQPQKLQKTLKKTSLIGLAVNPRKDDIFKTIVEERAKTPAAETAKRSLLKAIANTASYGINIQIDVDNANEEVEVNGVETFSLNSKKIEKTGLYFNPIAGTFITAGARLVLAIIEVLLQQKNSNYAFCDTDSMAIEPQYVELIQDFFKPLNPYLNIPQMFKVEKDDDGEFLENVWFYGISTKRYVIYDINGNDIDIRKNSSHGLGHLISPFPKNIDFEREIWLDILKSHYFGIDFSEKYANFYPLTSLTITTPRLLSFVNEVNLEKPYQKQIKPFNFLLVGYGNKKLAELDKKPVKPITPFSKLTQEVVYGEFIDANTNRKLTGLEYWMTLEDTVSRYLSHHDGKYEGESGILKRKSIHIDKLTQIGKETHNLDGLKSYELPTIFGNLAKDYEKILSLNPAKAKEFGIAKRTLKLWKSQIRSKTKIKIQKKNKQKLEFLFESIKKKEIDQTSSCNHTSLRI